MSLRHIPLALLLIACTPAPDGRAVTIAPSAPRTTDDLVANVDVPDGWQAALRYEWYQDGRLRVDLPSERVPASRTAKGEVWRVVATFGGRSGLTPMSASVRIANTAPSVEARWRVDPPGVEDDLEVRAIARDPDADPVVLTWTWTRDGEPTAHAGPVVPSADTRRGEVWTVTLAPADPDEPGAPVTLTARVDNTAPTIGVVRLDPWPAYAQTPIVASPLDVRDPDEDPVDLTWEFHVDGQIVQRGPSPRLHPGPYLKRQIVRARAIPNDPYQEGPARWSDALVIDNAPPTPPGARITTEDPRGGAPLTCAVAVPSTDPDGDPLSYGTLWRRDGAPVPDSLRSGASSTIEAGVARPGERWACAAIVTDGDTTVGGPIDEVHLPRPIARVGASWTHTCALQDDGRLWCWGDNSFGALGDGTTRQSLRPVLVRGKLPFIDVAAGGHHTCALDPDDRAWCWGNNWWGQLGDGTYIERRTPVPVAGDHRFKLLSTGAWHTCGVDHDDRAWCWGANVGGLIGDGTTTDRSAPTPVAGGHRWRGIAASLYHTCGVTLEGRLACWADGRWGQTGDGAGRYTFTPTFVDGHSYDMVSSTSLFTCALRADDASIWCFGANESGQLGDGSRTARFRPAKVLGDGRYSRVAAAGSHTCAIEEGGTVWCWGDNTVHQLGDGATAPSLVPRLSTHDLGAVVRVVPGSAHTCALGPDRWGYEAAWCWGGNGMGQLGDGTTASRADLLEIRLP